LLATLALVMNETFDLEHPFHALAVIMITVLPPLVMRGAATCRYCAKLLPHPSIDNTQVNE